MQPDLLDALLAHWPDNLSGLCAFEVGLSGGLDSMVLLSLLARARQYRPQLQLSAVHVHHGLNAAADDWVLHCQDVCQQLAIPLRVERVVINRATGESLEAQARQQRYTVFARSAAEVLVLAHHLDDQSETVLLQLLRGGGVRALSGMPVLRRLENLQLWRPLLGLTRQQLEQYASEQGLSWVEDDSNADIAYRRNLLRHRIMPLLQQHVPSYRQQLGRTAWHMAQASQLVDEVAAADLASCMAGTALDVGSMLSLSAVRQGFLLMAWLRSLGQAQVAPEQLQEFLRQLRVAAAASQPCLHLPEMVVVRYRQQLYAVPVLSQQSACVLRFDPAQSVCLLPGWGGSLRWKRRGGLTLPSLAGNLQLRPRLGGEVLQQMVGRKPVKKLLQEAGIPPLLRRQWPLLYAADGRLLALPGVAVASDCFSPEGYWPDWQPGLDDEKKAPR
ncbi:tRNA lysidine(34) synthetase TilS [Aquitalea aquatica]|uniref:tRNA(Ile)-lysidine synthase n=1 Tax=Aquitalea aquatica TaxID=3044273 RepID=A0A838Y2Y9_9NEIS|nr:tRNA lysidine(34) synthetase TilS [Aquitalea magnusonii]MBA4706937.1 tRNA lysidine(34) synthetase TilS [Aquitalea magnusonii]